MCKLNSFIPAAAVAAAGFLMSGAVWAGGPTLPPVQVPEPGLFGIAAAGAAAVLIAARLRRRN